VDVKLIVILHAKLLVKLIAKQLVRHLAYFVMDAKFVRLNAKLLV